MKELNQFEREYFRQTRKEINAEQRSRDMFLTLAALLLAAAAFALLRDSKEGKLDELVGNRLVFWFTVSGMFITTSLFWVRRKKLEQIADRWVVLRRLVSKTLESADRGRSLEDIACDGLLRWRFSIVDAVLALVFSVPFYAVLHRHGLDGLIAIAAYVFIWAIVFVPKLRNRTALLNNTPPAEDAPEA